MGRNSGYKVSDRGLIVAFSASAAFQTLLNSLSVLEVCAEGAECVGQSVFAELLSLGEVVFSVCYR